MAASLFLLCLVLATSSAVPRGDRKLKDSATAILAFTEEQGGQILSEVLLGKHVENGVTRFDRIVIEDFRQFLTNILNKVTTFKTDVITSRRHNTDKASPKRASRSTHYTSSDVVLPPGSDLEYLDYKDILDIIGDYTKGFVDTVVPDPLGYVDRDAFLEDFNSLVDQIILEIREIIEL